MDVGSKFNSDQRPSALINGLLYKVLTRFMMTALFVIIAAMPIIGHGGGLGVALFVFILGCLGLLLLFADGTIKPPPVWWVALAAFLLWLLISAFWSPYGEERAFTNALKLLIMGLVFAAAIPVFRLAADRSSLIFEHLLMATSFMGAGLMVLDLMAGYGLTFIFDPLKPDEIINTRQADAEMNIGHGITLLALIVVPVSLMMIHRIKHGAILAVIFIILLLLGAYLCRLSIGYLAIFAALLSATLAWFRPKTAIYLLFGIAMSVIIFAPLLGYLSGLLSTDTLQSLPLSWEHRLRMWAYSWQKITANPIFGNGFDAARTYSETFTAKQGWEVVIVSLHPHNAGLHLWMEAGFVGVMFAVATLFFTMKLAIGFAESRMRAAGLVGFMASMICISSLTYGAWQYWWWGALFFGIGILHFLPDLPKYAGKSK